MANLVRNYAAIKPNVQTAPSTMELNQVLLESARIMLMRYLRLVRDARRNGTQPSSEEELVKWRVRPHVQCVAPLYPPVTFSLHKLQAVDTVYVKLLIETGQKADVLEIFASSPATIVLDEVVPLLEQYGYFGLLIQIYRSANDERAQLNIWSRYASSFLPCEVVDDRELICCVRRRIAEGQWTDAEISNPVGEIIQLLSVSKNRDLIQEYGIWLARNEPVAAFTVS
jgi:hypothetical protein